MIQGGKILCGIVGIVGDEVKVEDVIDGLKKLEYRGYDSAGIAYRLNGDLKIHKRPGRIDQLKKEIYGELKLKVETAIAHTRWATHGSVNEINSHPHTDCSGKIAIVHNGIIENFEELRRELRSKGHKFKSDTDTEVIAHLIEENYSGDLLESVIKAVGELEGAYAIGVIHTDHPGVIVAARKGSPLVVGKNENTALLASDVTPLIKYTRDVVFLEDGEIALITKEKIDFFDLKGNKLNKKKIHIDWDESSAEKGGYRYFMEKEIFEQPIAIKSALAGRIKDGEPYLSEIKGLEDFIKNKMRKIFIVACGTSYHAGLAFKYLMNLYSDVDIDIEVASEFRYMNPHVDENTLVIAISQSGETADTLEGVRISKRKGAKILTISNVVGSTIPRESDFVVYMNTGPEIGVAATKTYTAQIAILYILAALILKWRKKYSEDIKVIIKQLEQLPEYFEQVLKKNEYLLELARKYRNYQHMMYIGRAFGYVTALEGALKLKEISYIHAAGYQAGELKHGPIALLDEEFPVFAIIPQDRLYEKMYSNIMESRARNARIIAIGTEGDEKIGKIVNEYILVPKVHEAIYPIIMAPLIQLFAYHVAVLRNHDPDKPRNLAKSVTVE